MYNIEESGTNIGTVMAPEKKQEFITVFRSMMPRQQFQNFYAIQIKFLQLQYLHTDTKLRITY